MDLYLLSPLFLRKMIRRSSAGPSGVSDIKDLDLDDVLRVGGESESESESEMEEMATYNRDGRRRSSLDRMLRQHAYIIICVLCYACTLPGQGTWYNNSVHALPLPPLSHFAFISLHSTLVYSHELISWWNACCSVGFCLTSVLNWWIYLINMVRKM